jgi:hypothetical protein
MAHQVVVAPAVLGAVVVVVARLGHQGLEVEGWEEGREEGREERSR